jgi:hypothetical protein
MNVEKEMKMLEWIEERLEEPLAMTDFNDCIIGICSRFGQEPIIAYDRQKVIDKMITRDGMTWSEAEEFHETNQVGAWMGDSTPCFISMPEEDVERVNKEVPVGFLRWLLRRLRRKISERA